MNIIERGRAFLQGLRELAERSAWDRRRCPHCGDTLTCTWGSSPRRPWLLTGRQTLRVRRHRCESCRQTYSEQSALLVRGGWYAREVRRAAIDGWQHTGSSVRRTAAWLRSWLGRQERWRLWRPLDPERPDAQQCHLSASTVERWLDRAGRTAEQTVAGQLQGIAASGQVGTDGLWARLRGGAKRVVLALTDSVSGLVWPPVVVSEEATAGSWETLFVRAKAAGLDWEALRGVTSDGAAGLAAYLDQTLTWVNHQRCVFHIWRNLGGELGRAVAGAVAGLAGAALAGAQRRVRRERGALVRTAGRRNGRWRRLRRIPRDRGWRWRWRGWWMRRWWSGCPSTRACSGLAQSGCGGTSGWGRGMDATTGRRHGWSGRPWSGASTAISSQPRSGVKGSGAIAGPGAVHERS